MIPPSPSTRERALGAFFGLAIGDALGMPTESLSREQVLERYGGLIADFLPAAADHPVAAGLPAGAVTDDTEQSVLVARLLVEGGGRITPGVLADALATWASDAERRGRSGLLGPSTRRALDALAAGEPVERAGRFGTTNGAAMRIVPLALATPADDLDALVGAVHEVSLATHNTGPAIAAAAAIAAAVSAGVAGADLDAALGRGVEAARRAAPLGHFVAGADVATRCEWAMDLVAGCDPEQVVSLVDTLVGTSLAAQESVPAAFALAAALGGAPFDAVRRAASLGGDADTIAALLGALCGSCAGVHAFPPAACETVEQVNDLALAPLVDDLLALRARRTLWANARAARGGRAPRLVHAGSVIADLVLEVDALPSRGSDADARGRGLVAGGGVNVMVAAARRGVSVAYAGAHGTGRLGRLVRSALVEAGVELIAPARLAEDTGITVALVEPDGERTFVTRRGAERHGARTDDLVAALAPGDILSVSGYLLLEAQAAAALDAALAQLVDGVIVCFDPGPHAADLAPERLRALRGRTDWLSLNAREAAALSGEEDPDAAARALCAWPVRAGVVVRTGPDGCVVATPGAPPAVVGGFPVSVRDTSGAGDTHVGTFLAELLVGTAPLVALERANAASALAVARPGPGGAPTARELAAFLSSRRRANEGS